MKDLIEALQIFIKYQNVKWPTHCEHDVLSIMDITEDEVSDEDKKRLSELSFEWSDEDDCFQSFRFGSA
jgi:hypothetical protein